MTREEVRSLIIQEYGSCGSLDVAFSATLRLLRLHSRFDNQAELTAWLPDKNIQSLVLHSLHRMGLIEYGSSIQDAWLTDKGREVMEVLEAEEVTGFEALLPPREANS